MLHNFWFNYEWPSIRGNGPEDITSLIVVGIIASFVVPRIRHWWATREAAMHDKINHMLKQNAHIIKHSEEIPNESHDGSVLSEVPERLR